MWGRKGETLGGLWEKTEMKKKQKGTNQKELWRCKDATRGALLLDMDNGKNRKVQCKNERLEEFFLCFLFFLIYFMFGLSITCAHKEQCLVPLCLLEICPPFQERRRLQFICTAKSHPPILDF